jgi:uncharacterized damage-inducible protein DinB
MDTASQAQQTIGDQMPWYGMTMEYTGKICELIPQQLWHWRPEDPQGHFQASLGEIAMHCADERHGYAHALSGKTDRDVFFTLSPGKDGINKFREGVSKQDVLASLRAGRALLDSYAHLPADRLTEVTEGAKAAYKRQIASVKEQGIDTTRMEMRGAPGIFRVLMAVACHEAGHRGTLYTLLRLNGVSLPGEV